MTIDWLGAILWIGGGGAFLIATIWLVRRSERRLSIGPRDPYTPMAPGPDGADPISAYLDRMTGTLALPAGDVAEVRAELADHLRDSIATLEAEGFEREAAIREALGRLGPPAELGRQLRAAHQSTRRLLAGVGGGVFAAGGGFVLGYIGGVALALLLVIVLSAAAAVLTLVGVRLPDVTSPSSGQAVNSLMLSVMLAVAAAFATRYAVRTSAGLSRRAPRTVAIFWVAAAVLVFGWWALFGVRGQQSWLGVAAELCIPLAAVAGALVRIERPMPHVGRWAIVCSAISVGVLVLGLGLASGSSVGGTGQGHEYQPADLHLDTVAPAAPPAWLPADDYVVTEQDGGQASATHIDARVISPSSG
ncbi:MAG TPA: permease prefix domain 1-containing protein, partial [Candidatus Limnocylindrales bacterium]